MPPPQSADDHARPKPRDSSVPAVKRAPPTPAAPCASAPAKKMTRPTSAPDLKALSAARPRPPSTPAKNGAKADGTLTGCGSMRPAAKTDGALTGGGPRRPAARTDSGSRRPAAKTDGAQADDGRRRTFMAPRGAQTVHPTRRLPPGTAVYVRTTFRPRNIRCRIQLWLRARVVSCSDAYHCTVKYAADLNDMFAGKIVSKPVEHVRVAPHRTPAKPKPQLQPTRMAPAPPEAKAAFSLPRR